MSEEIIGNLEALKEADKDSVYYEHIENGVHLPLANGKTVTFKASGIDAALSVDKFGRGLLRVDKNDKETIKAIESHPKFLKGKSWDEASDQERIGKAFYRKLTAYEEEIARRKAEADKFVSKIKGLIESGVMSFDVKTAKQEELFDFANKCGVSVKTEDGTTKTKAQVASELEKVLK